MDLTTKQSLVRALAKAYLKADRKEKTTILNQLVLAAGYHRKYATLVLNHPPKVPSRTKHRRRSGKYWRVLPSLRKLWRIGNYACGKRLVGMLPSYIETLTRDGELTISEEEVELLLKASAATIDRLLSDSKTKRRGGKGRSTTKPGTLLKRQIPIKVFTPWDERRPGFVEVDLVAHCGSNLRGNFAYTLDTIDLDLGWSECAAFLGKSESAAREAINTIHCRYPVPLLGIDSDNDSAFINWHFYRWCTKEKITFTRCREYHKNDQAHVEEKNWSVVRKYVGYHRYDTSEQVDFLNQLYGALRLYFNFFQATLKLERKIRDGGKVKRVYGKAKIPYRRVLDHPDIPQASKDKLTALYQTLNPACLLREIEKINQQLLKTLPR